MFAKEQYMREVKEGYVTRRVHSKHPQLVILSYSEYATEQKRWNEVTTSCRGLILDESTGEVVARPFPKFFYLGEMPEFEKDIPFAETPEFTVKQDGCLGICYRVGSQLHWATRGSFESVQAKAAQVIWDQKYAQVKVPDELTLMVEIIHPSTREFVDYKGMCELIVIGAIDRFTGHDYGYGELLQLGETLGMKVTDRVHLTVSEAIKRKDTLDPNSEGWVLRWSNGKRLKIKGTRYLEGIRKNGKLKKGS